MELGDNPISNRARGRTLTAAAEPMRPVSQTKRRLVGVEEILHTLSEEGPLSSARLARRLELNPLDARLALLAAHARGLVRTTSQGEWAITDHRSA